MYWISGLWHRFFGTWLQTCRRNITVANFQIENGFCIRNRNEDLQNKTMLWCSSCIMHLVWVSLWVHHSDCGYDMVCSLWGRKLSWKNTSSSKVIQPALPPYSISLDEIRWSFVYSKDIEMTGERGRGIVNEYYDIISHDVTLLEKPEVCLICCRCDEN